jgi:hypothetical protein
MKSGQSLCQSFIVAGQAAEARRPGKSAFNHPGVRRQDKTALDFGMLDHLQLDAVLLGGRGGIYSDVELKDEGPFDILSITSRTHEKLPP